MDVGSPILKNVECFLVEEEEKKKDEKNEYLRYILVKGITL
jgi:hypothetical protein